MKGLFLLKLFMVNFIIMLSFYAHGSTTSMWTQSTESDFSKGIRQNVSVHSANGIQLSPQSETITGIKGNFVWSVVSDAQNRVFVSTGDEGAVYLIKEGLEAMEFFKSPEIHIQSLAIDRQGNLYAGTAPSGIIYKINDKGNATVFCSLPATYVWDMAVDADSNLFAATGNDGILFKVSPDGVPTVFFDSPETNLLDILLDQGNNIYIGTEPNGLVYKVLPSGDAHVLYDASEGEIHCISMDLFGNIYAGTASGAQVQAPPPPAGRLPVQTGTPVQVFREEAAWDLNLPEELPVAQSVPIQQQKPITKNIGPPAKTINTPTAPNYIYKIGQDGLTKKIFEISQAFILGTSLDKENNLYVVTGNNPGVYKVFEDETSSNLVDVAEGQALCCLTTLNNELYFGTGSSGKVYKMLPSFVKEGDFLSNVFDTNTLSDWGRIYWEDTRPCGTSITLATRSGNCEKPDFTWSGWSEVYALSGVRITSPPARFVQYKATLQTTDTSATPALNTVSLSYLPKNQPPAIISFAIEGESSHALQKPSEAKTDGKTESKAQTHVSQKQHHQIAQKNIQWEVEDPNNDTLQVIVYYKGADEKAWKTIDKTTQKKGSYVWDTLRLPDGKYQARLVVSDEPDNPPENALSSEITTQPFVVDNSRPVVRINASAGTNFRFVISGVARDDHSNIIKVQYTIDGQEWISAYPVDGVFDSQEESFQINTRPLAPGDYTLIVNVFDSEGNIGIEKVMFEVK